MFKRIFILMLSLSLLGTTFGLQSVWAQTTIADDQAAQTRAKLEQLRARNARVEVKLRDNTKMKGYVSSVDQDGFTLTDAKRGGTRLAFVDVASVKKSSGGISTRSWAILAAAAAGAVVT